MDVPDKIINELAQTLSNQFKTYIHKETLEIVFFRIRTGTMMTWSSGWMQ
ncbi:MAG: hypothetical protein ACXWV4_05680 [Flavitalea sp.]